MTPPELIRYGFGRTSIAALLVAASSSGVVAVAIREEPDQEALIDALRARFPGAELRLDSEGMRSAIEVVIKFVEHPQHNIDLALDIRGTPFQRRVWAAVMKIPFGKTTTFAAIAKAIGSPQAVRAVGSACTRNPLEFAIPCHRVLRSNGSFSGGSAWGDRRQATLVQREAAAVQSTDH
jgi:AraC family transcriptional regulator, regulatory protein of adaptative response / methylated-DNA-[protein]-cysteine methyltransferase